MTLPTYRNPIVVNRADPWVLRHEPSGHYYFTASVPEYDRIELRRATTIGELGTAEPAVIWRKRATGIMGHHIWAPELHQIDGVWYVYFAAGGAERIWDIRMYALSCDAADPLAGPWVERGQIKANWESFSLDATTFVHRGKRYMSWAQNDPKLGPGTSLYLAEMDGPLAIKGTQVRISRPTLDWEVLGHRVNEGPAFIARGDKVFISYSASATDHRYGMGLLTASADADLLDAASWKKSPTPVFATNEANGQYGPGHNSFTLAEDGKTDVMVYHTRSYRDVLEDPLRDPNRHARAQAFTWRDDGTPDFGVPTPDAYEPPKLPALPR